MFRKLKKTFQENWNNQVIYKRPNKAEKDRYGLIEDVYIIIRR